MTGTALLVATALAVLVPTQDRQLVEGWPAVDAAALLDAYALGQDGALAAALNRPAALTSLKRAFDELDLEGADRRRREVAAAVAVEAAQLGGGYDSRMALELIEWGCHLLRRDDARTEAERLFHWAALAVIEGMAHPGLEIHADHALRRFGDEARFELARALAVELRTFPDPRPSERLGRRDGELFVQLVTRLERAARFPGVRAEALARLGFASLRDNNPERALRYLDDMPSTTDDPWVRYLGHLFRGRALERLGRAPEAVEAFRAATAVVPGAQSATLALGAALLRANARDDASALGWAVTAVPAEADPWIGYGQADLRFWPEIRAKLREAVR